MRRRVGCIREGVYPAALMWAGLSAGMLATWWEEDGGGLVRVRDSTVTASPAQVTRLRLQRPHRHRTVSGGDVRTEPMVRQL